MSITEYFKKKIKRVRYGQLGHFDETPAVNMTEVLLHPKNILIIPYNRMGTTLLVTRVLKSMREHFKSSKITVVVYEPWSVLISKDPAIDNVITYGDEIENPNSRSFQKVGTLLAEQKFDLAFFLSYQFDPVIAYLMRISNAVLRVSFRSDNEIPYFNVEIEPAHGNRYEVDRYLEMLRTIGIQGKIRDYTLKISNSIRDKARLRFLPGESPRQKTAYIGFDLTKEIAGEPLGKKSAEYSINTLISGFNSTVIAFYEPQKKNLAAELKEIFGKKIILVEDRPVSLVAGLLTFCKFIVTSNTDLFQLSIALKIPTIAILTPHEMIQWSPGENDNLIHLKRSDSSWPSAKVITESSKRILSLSMQSH